MNYIPDEEYIPMLFTSPIPSATHENAFQSIISTNANQAAFLANNYTHTDNTDQFNDYNISSSAIASEKETYYLNFTNQSSQSPQSIHNSNKIYMNFLSMTLSFSLNHGCVVSCLAYSSSLLGNQLGSVANGILYVSFAISAFLIANPLVISIGPKNGLLCGSVGYTIFVFGFLASLLLIYTFSKWLVVFGFDMAWCIACPSSLIGGLAGGLFWTAQGRSFSRHAKLYSQSTGISVEKINSNFADDLDDIGTWEFSYKTISNHVGSAGRLIYSDPKLLLITPFQLSFGFTSSMITYYILGTIVSKSRFLGSSYVGLFAAITVLSGAVSSIPLANISNLFGKIHVLSIGSLCFVLVGFIMLMRTDEELGHWLPMLLYLTVFGIGRGVWENTNKAAIADLYSSSPNDCTTAFASNAFFTGYSSAIGFFTFSEIPRRYMAMTITSFGILSFICYPLAFFVHKYVNEQKEFALHRKEVIKRQFYEHVRSRELPRFDHHDDLVHDNIL
eukprot:gene14205-19059_t